MSRKKLIFFVAADPAATPSPVSAAYHFATAAAAADLESEVRLAGDAVLVADPAYVATLQGSEALRQRIDDAATGGVQISFCPRSAESRAIPEEQLRAIGAERRALADILTEVADGRSVLVHL